MTSLSPCVQYMYRMSLSVTNVRILLHVKTCKLVYFAVLCSLLCLSTRFNFFPEGWLSQTKRPHPHYRRDWDTERMTRLPLTIEVLSRERFEWESQSCSSVLYTHDSSKKCNRWEGRVRRNGGRRCRGGMGYEICGDVGVKVVKPINPTLVDRHCTWAILQSIFTELVLLYSLALSDGRVEASVACDWQVFQLATASHHLIYSSSLMLSETRQLTPLFAVLMSDLLLLTRPDPDNGSLVVLSEPLSLQHVVGSNFHCNHRKSFILPTVDRQ